MTAVQVFVMLDKNVHCVAVPTSWPESRALKSFRPWIPILDLGRSQTGPSIKTGSPDFYLEMARCPVLTAVVGSLPRETPRHLYHRNSITLPIDRRRYLSLSDSPDSQINPVADSGLLRVAILARKRWW